ncbi:hypothetical protein Pcinc_018630 [Petrolisthes cinctipes]|uniref:Cadherin domain-containing protein n=1 Tax=Petrolisthes cinctipes TaxID=88211 RepID=A0AAE1KIU1_PETCI|nr:hypothetical protein Pcinc_018630 [Petrolisthes cinctipes]
MRLSHISRVGQRKESGMELPPAFLRSIAIVMLPRPNNSHRRNTFIKQHTIPSGEVRYGLNGGNSEGLFSIHPTTGVITLAAQLDYEVADKVSTVYFLHAVD